MATIDPVMRRRLLMLGPLGLAGVAGGAFLAMLLRMNDGKFDPRGVPSPLVGRPIPDFTLPGQTPDATGFSAADIRAAGRPILVNFFASWCAPCVIEAPVLTQVKDSGLPIWGIAYKDRAADTASFLSRQGNPYVRLARDEPGRAAIDWGVYGVPETYFIDRTGTIRWKWAGPLSAASVADDLLPLLKHYA